MKPRRIILAALAVYLSFTLWTGSGAGQGKIDLEELRNGLVATYRDGAKVEIVRLDPAFGFTWKAGEAAHPRLTPDGETVEWQGYINILRAGNYRFSATLRGQFQITVAGKDVFKEDHKGDVVARVDGPQTRIEAGVHPVTARFTRHPGAARLELFWVGPGFVKEPLPYDVLFHDPAKAPPKLAADHQVERGRFLVEERGCLACHKPEAGDKLAKGMITRQGPDLSQVGGRVHPGWLYHWVLDPHQVRPGGVMPKVLGGDEVGKADAYAITRYLTSLGAPLKDTAKPPDDKTKVAAAGRGEKLFHSVGCSVCHREDKAKEEKSTVLFHGLAKADGSRPTYPLVNLGSKTTPDKLAAFLVNPHATDPQGRMPNMLLDAKDATDLAHFLTQSKSEKIKDELPAAPRPPDGQPLADEQWVALGQKRIVERGCTSCHDVAPGGKALPAIAAKTSFDAIKKSPAAGCLADGAKQRGQAPDFRLAAADRQAFRAFLKDGASGPGTPAPTYAARVALERFNCIACHGRDGEGGLTPELVEQLRKYEKTENAEAVMPPPLTGVGHKLRTAWMKQVLTQRGRARPWMGLRMPQFGEAHVGPLAEALALAEGTEPDDTVHQVPLTAAKIEAGRTLVGKTAFGCISCHDIAGIPNFGTRGPDMALMNQRTRYDWYLRWLSEAQRMQPGTRMPTVFLDGKSSYDKVLAGDAHAQAEAMWAYLSLGPSLPLPEGMDPPKGLILSVKDRPVLLRTFLPEAGSRAMAIGYPGGLALAFDAATCRLAYGWSGNFLDASPVWDGRGGTPAKILGPRFWTSPQGHPWALTRTADPPDFAAQAKDPAFGAGLPDNKVFTGVKQVQFMGYALDPAGVPTFQYQIAAANVTEKPEPVRSAVAQGVRRRFTVNVPADHTPWLLAGETTGIPRVLEKGTAQALDLKQSRIELPTADRLLVLPQGERPVVLSAVNVPAGSKWLLQKQGNAWQALLRLPAKQGETAVEVVVWSLFKDEPALLKELVTGK